MMKRVKNKNMTKQRSWKSPPVETTNASATKNGGGDWLSNLWKKNTSQQEDAPKKVMKASISGKHSDSKSFRFQMAKL